jgi:hypothetical protein
MSTITLSFDGNDCFVLCDGLKIARRGDERNWVPLEPGWTVFCDPYRPGDMTITVEHDPTSVQ